MIAIRFYRDEQCILQSVFLQSIVILCGNLAAGFCILFVWCNCTPHKGEATSVSLLLHVIVLTNLFGLEVLCLHSLQQPLPRQVLVGLASQDASVTVLVFLVFRAIKRRLLQLSLQVCPQVLSVLNLGHAMKMLRVGDA